MNTNNREAGMMKPEIPLKSGDEQDAFTRFRHMACVFFNNTGLVKWAQRKYHKRVRQHTKKAIAQQIKEVTK